MAADSNTFGNFLKTASPKVKKQVYLLLGAGAFVVALTLGTILWIWQAHRGPSVTEQVIESSRKMASHEPVSFQYSYEIKDMSMAVMNKKGTRTAYAQFTLIFDCEDEYCKKQLELNRAKLINGIFEVGGDFYVEDFEAPLAAKGFMKFKDQIREKTVQYFGKRAPKLVVLKDWVMN